MLTIRADAVALTSGLCVMLCMRCNTLVQTMNEATFTFRVDETLKSKFTDAARARDRTGAQLLRDFMRGVVSQQEGAVEYDAWFRQEVEAALAEANNPATQWISNEQAKREGAAWRQRVRAAVAGKR